MKQDEIRLVNFRALKKSDTEKNERIEYYKTHCLVCERTWNETGCGTILLKKFGNIGICAECADKSKDGLPIEATERFREATRLFHGAEPWTCNNGKLWIWDSSVPHELRTSAMRLVMD